MSVPTIAAEPFRRSNIVSLDGLGLVSSYPEKSPYAERNLVGRMEHTDWGLEGMAHALVACQQLVLNAGGTLSITEAGRKFAVSAKARDKYLRGEKHAYVAPAGGSMHNAGAAVDWWVYDLRFKGVPKDKWLEKLWDIVIPQGFVPIIKQPSLKASECWHFDWRGPWQATYDWFKQHKLSKAYDRMARCRILDAGAWDFEFDKEHDAAWMQAAYVQAQLHRVGVHEVGDVDGVAGRNTRGALSYVSSEMRMPTPLHFGNLEHAAAFLNGVNDDACNLVHKTLARM
jgi:hypothetical protein